jgi:hypothetical protein
MKTLRQLAALTLLMLAASPSPAQQPGTVRWKTPIGNATFSRSDGPLSSGREDRFSLRGRSKVLRLEIVGKSSAGMQFGSCCGQECPRSVRLQ